jgi:hypothetical protein
MRYSDCLREQAAKYRKLAETAEDAFARSFSNWRPFVRRWRMKSTTSVPVDNRK